MLVRCGHFNFCRFLCGVFNAPAHYYYNRVFYFAPSSCRWDNTRFSRFVRTCQSKSPCNTLQRHERWRRSFLHIRSRSIHININTSIPTYNPRAKQLWFLTIIRGKITSSPDIALSSCDAFCARRDKITCLDHISPYNIYIKTPKSPKNKNYAYCFPPRDIPVTTYTIIMIIMVVVLFYIG